MDGDAHPDKVAFRDRREQVIAQLTGAFSVRPPSRDSNEAGRPAVW
jgi:hypothetical protein